ncbi:transglutaminase-like cysteine peptidase [uncultured Ferrimonas sp.]|uniref:transglutaminase-like cysteine peptidase n=1 Tax=uncultured Ferrimonas sp. TaxID=432640 RepID=UPI002623C655|nr:transglutaminase-like cysteine peptidase [uncultured Ferrimonas sp.]
MAITVASTTAAAADSLTEQVVSRYGLAAQQRLQQWQQALTAMQSLPPAQQLQAVNRLANSMAQVTDQQLWGQTDYWASNAEFIGAGGGDCEDFSIAKFHALLQLGFNPKQLRLAYVKAQQQQQYHVVLAYYPKQQAVPLLLDNLNPNILPADQRPDLIPVFSFNAAQLWLNVNRYDQQSVGDINDFSLWQKVQQRRQPKQPLLDLPFTPLPQPQLGNQQ